MRLSFGIENEPSLNSATSRCMATSAKEILNRILSNSKLLAVESRRPKPLTHLTQFVVVLRHFRTSCHQNANHFSHFLVTFCNLSHNLLKAEIDITLIGTHHTYFQPVPTRLFNNTLKMMMNSNPQNSEEQLDKVCIVGKFCSPNPFQNSHRLQTSRPSPHFVL